MQDGVRLYWALAACGAIAAAYAIYRLFVSVNRDRFVTDTPLARIRSAAQGYARLQGRAGSTAPEVLVAPLSGRAVCVVGLSISVKETDSRGNSSWSELERATSVTPFPLADQDGRCLVGPVGAEVTPTSSDIWYGDAPRPVAGPPQHGWIGALDHTYRYTERLIAPGTQLVSLGELRSHAEDREVDSDARLLLTTWKADQPDLLARFDGNRDGRIDPQEWELRGRSRSARGRRRRSPTRASSAPTWWRSPRTGSHSSLRRWTAGSWQIASGAMRGCSWSQRCCAWDSPSSRCTNCASRPQLQSIQPRSPPRASRRSCWRLRRPPA